MIKVPLVSSLKDELVRMWSMSEDEFCVILVALFITWMKPFSKIVEKYLAWSGDGFWMSELMLESRQMYELWYDEVSSNKS